MTKGREGRRARLREQRNVFGSRQKYRRGRGRRGTGLGEGRVRGDLKGIAVLSREEPTGHNDRAGARVPQTDVGVRRRGQNRTEASHGGKDRGTAPNRYMERDTKEMRGAILSESWGCRRRETVEIGWDGTERKRAGGRRAPGAWATPLRERTCNPGKVRRVSRVKRGCRGDEEMAGSGRPRVTPGTR